MSVRSQWPAGLRRVNSPTWPAVTAESQKEHGRIDSDAELPLLQSYIEAATEFVEKEQNRCLRRSTWLAVYDCWPADGLLTLPLPPLASVTSIIYTDSAGAEQTLSSSLYVVDINSEPGRVLLREMPDIDDRPGAIKVTFKAGYVNATAIPETTKQAIRELVQHKYENREAAVVGSVVQSVPFSVQDLLNQNKFLCYR